MLLAFLLTGSNATCWEGNVIATPLPDLCGAGFDLSSGNFQSKAGPTLRRVYTRSTLEEINQRIARNESDYVFLRSEHSPPVAMFLSHHRGALTTVFAPWFLGTGLVDKDFDEMMLKYHTVVARGVEGRTGYRAPMYGGGYYDSGTAMRAGEWFNPLRTAPNRKKMADILAELRLTTTISNLQELGELIRKLAEYIRAGSEGRLFLQGNNSVLMAQVNLILMSYGFNGVEQSAQSLDYWSHARRLVYAEKLASEVLWPEFLKRNPDVLLAP